MERNNVNGGNYEVETEVSGASEVTQEVSFEETSAGPSKGFIAGCVGIGAAAIAGIVFAVKKHNKKKKDKAQAAAEDDYDDYDENYYEDEGLEEVETGVVEPEQKAESEKAEEKK